MTRIALLLPLLILSFSTAFKNNTSATLREPTIQIALLLDTSNSMDGLIDQAKSQLWKMVNNLATTKKNGKTPKIEIALYEYGNDRLSVDKGYVRQVAALTHDLDEISNQLFKLTTNGGSEYCGWVLKEAVTDLKWTNQTGDLRLVVIAGNEPFDQGPVSPKTATTLATDKDICITTIFCGSWQEGKNTGWQLDTRSDCNSFLNIDQDEEVIHLPTPYDDTIAALNQALNNTYLAYGHSGREKLEMQARQDRNALSYNMANMRERASFKAKKQYNAADWDLVDAAKENPAIIEETEAEALPENMRNMSMAERKSYINIQSENRAELKEQILHFEKMANKYIDENQADNEAAHTLDAVMKEAILNLAARRGFDI